MKKRNPPRRGNPRGQEPVAPERAPEIPEEGMRLNKYLARAGVASRRKADEFIEKGQVKVNGKVETSFGYRVQEGDEVEVNGTVVSPRSFVYVLLNKPADTITTTDDERDRQTVLDLISMPEKEKEGLFPVGRLDRHTLGVLLLTNDGDLAHRLMHPRYEIDKLYRVRTKAAISPDQIEQLRSGIMLDDGPARADQVAYIDPPNQHEIGLSIHEGRNRQIRRMMEALGHEVDRLERINYAGLTTEGLRRGKWRKLYPHEVQRLRRRVKLK